ncbi:MAG TPA: DUF599 domain-containing protein [Casimicrobiaceae bacterium]|jgi:uncharacterized membrane protein|nr:DUF599 domain-containing protein [Casimicrobiaceae bacterium]
MDSPYLSDFLGAALSVAIVIGYHAFLRLRVRRDPGYTIQAVLNRGRTAWVERMMADNAGILAVQTLRNSIMGATFFASTAIALIVGTITLSMQSDKVTVAWHSLSPIGAIDTQLWLPKLLVLLIDMLIAFVFFSQSIRLMSHVGVMISVPTTTARPTFVASLLIQAGRYHTRGMRCYYFAAPLLFWLFGPLLLVSSTCALVAALYYLDKSPARVAAVV